MNATETLAIAKTISAGVKHQLDTMPKDGPDPMPEALKPIVHNTTRLVLGLIVNVARIADALEKPTDAGQ